MVVTFVVTIFFWSSPSLVFKVFAMASGDSFSFSRVLFYYLAADVFCLLSNIMQPKVKIKIKPK